ncbi:hypothetical protein [Streptomyces sp. NPDC005930]|uniref:hypothetical protein n=1 Tax=Streptomyces sp. NPDC005930 TaxID=3364736 RepID=UPI0036A28AD3
MTARPAGADMRVRMAAAAHSLDEQISSLTRLRDSLHHAAVCDDEPLIECPVQTRRRKRIRTGRQPTGRNSTST